MGKPHASYDFRNDINGLRAWAVVAVMFYHFGIPGFSGGFVGVDVFFVISGFLMTSIVVRGLEKRGGDESFVFDFYMARARRILPALIVLCAGLLVLGWWVLSPIDYKVLGIHAALSLVFLSNIKFWSEAGYFDAASHEKWLLHTWSLAVEWQFYLLLPLVLLAVWKVRPGRQSITVAISLGFLVSIALSIVLTPVKPSTAFYLLHTRAWELLAGGLVYLLSNQLELNAHQRKALELAGFGMVLGSVVGFDASTNWPGWRALIPVIGSILVLTAAQSHSALTGHFVTQWLGRSSYSIYLWHWPIVAMLAYLGLQTDAMAIGSGLALTLVLGYLSFRWVETPSRQHLFRCRTGYATSALLCGVLIVTIPAVGIWRNNGILSRTSAEMVLVEKEASNKNPRESSCFTKRGTSSPSCIYGGDRLRAILIGDSHAAAVTNVCIRNVR